MTLCRQQAFMEAPASRIWELVADVNRHPEWWPRIVDVECEELEEGCTYREVVRTPFGSEEEMVLRVEKLAPLERFTIHCENTGTFVRMALTEAQGGTFVDAEMGMQPVGVSYRLFDVIAGKRYFRRWLEQSMEALERTATGRVPGIGAEGSES